MRIRNLPLFILLALFSFLGKGQSVSIDLLTDSSSASGCDTTGETIYLQIDGSSSGISSGDSVAIVADHDDGSPIDTVDKGAVDGSGNYTAQWSHSWSTPGQKGITVAAYGPSGSNDSAITYLVIGDSCSASISPNSTFDTTASVCDTAGQDIDFYLEGNTAGFDGGDTLELWVDHDDGNGMNFVQNVFINGSFQNFYASWTHSWPTGGAKDVRMVIIDPTGGSDTAQHTVFISDSCATIEGKFYLDQNSDCSYNSGEPLLSNKGVKVEYGGNLVGYAHTDGSGTYQISVPSNQSPYEVYVVDSGKYLVSCPSPATQQVSNPPASNVDFAMECPSSIDFSVDHLWTGTFRPGFHSSIYMNLDGPLACTDSLECIKAVLPQDLSPASSDSAQPPYDAVNGDTLVWNMDTNDVGDISPGGFMVRTDSTATVGDSLCIELILCASSDADPSNNSMTDCGEVVDSWDPNNKRVTPQGSGAENYVAKDQRMSYTINFQNTGTAPAIDIVIEDTLDSDVLDPNSFRFIASSHDVDKLQIEEDSIFSFHYMDIMLPDSGTSQAKSKGFVSFSVDQAGTLSGGTVIENNAAIFFDNNPPVITNETMNTIGEPSSIEGRNGNRSMSVYPNPASERLHIRSEKALEGRIILRDMVGKEVSEQRINGQRSSIKVSELPSGIYILSVRTEGTDKPLRKKIVID